MTRRWGRRRRSGSQRTRGRRRRDGSPGRAGRRAHGASLGAGPDESPRLRLVVLVGAHRTEVGTSSRPRLLRTFGNSMGMAASGHSLNYGCRVTTWLKENVETLANEYPIGQGRIWSVARALRASAHPTAAGCTIRPARPGVGSTICTSVPQAEGPVGGKPHGEPPCRTVAGRSSRVHECNALPP